MSSKALMAPWALLLLVSVKPTAMAQTSPVANRILGPVSESRLVRLGHNTHPLARPEFDRGPAPPTLALERMRLVLLRSAQQESDLESLLQAQQDRSSPSFHEWLTPVEFGKRFGPSDQDIQIVTSWLTSQGFRVNGVAQGRTTIEFSGTADQVRTAFHTEIHKYVVNGEEHWANQSDPQIPAAMAPVVAGVATLHNFRAKPLYVRPRGSATLKAARDASPLAPEYNLGSGVRGLSPTDFATIYSVQSVYNSGIDGTGAVIGVLGDDLVSLQDIADFRRVFSLPSQTPEVVVSGTTPDFWTGDNSEEGVLDLEWSGAVAPGATLKYIIGASTDVSDGLDLAEQYAVDNNLADILTESYGFCEADMTSADATQLNAIRQQATAQGITWLVASGDSGSYCDAVIGDLGQLTSNGLASSPYVVAVGGSEFSSATNTLAFWSLTNNPTSYSSALSYVPEVAWNDSCSASQCGISNATIGASGGGVSTFYAKPPWQAGVAGIPLDGHRDTPDIALVASPDAAGYLTCYYSSCEGSTIGPSSFNPVGGTSGSAQAFGGVMALIVQKTKSRQGQANYMLYQLAAAEQYSQCVAYNSQQPNSLPAASCVFNDITSGNNTVPGEPGYNTTAGNYQAGTGYDLATGLGSVKVSALINQWNSSARIPTSASLSVTPSSFVHGSAATVDATVTPGKGSGVPSGDIALLSAPGQAGGVFTLSNGAVASTASALPGGSYQMTARYGGDSSYAASVSSPVSLTVTPEPVTASVGALYDEYAPNAYYSGGTYGATSLLLRADVAGLSRQGYPSGAVTFLDNGTPIGGGGKMDSQGHAISVDSSVVFTPGKHALIAQYAGDASFQPGISVPAIISVTKQPTVTGLHSNVTNATAGQLVTLTATVEGGSPPYGNPQTGTVTFYSGATAFGAPISIATAPDPVTGQIVGTATMSTSKLPAGTTTAFSAAYSGDANYGASTSGTWDVTVVSTTPTCQVTNFAADPNPVSIYDSGSTQITVAANCSFDLRVGSPSSPLQATAKNQLTTNVAINANTVVYLQRQGDTTAAGTLQTLPVGFQSGAVPCQSYGFAATPNPIVSATLSGITTVSGVAGCAFQIRQGSPQGTVLASSTLAGTGDYVAMATTASPVTNGTQFFIVETGLAKTSLASFTVRVLKSQPACPVAQFSASPQRILAAGPLGTTTIIAEAGCAFDIRIGSPSGALFTTGNGYASAQTGQWVTNGMTFYLQKAGDTTAAGTLQTTTVALVPSSARAPSSRSHGH